MVPSKSQIRGSRPVYPSMIQYSKHVPEECLLTYGRHQLCYLYFCGLLSSDETCQKQSFSEAGKID